MQRTNTSTTTTIEERVNTAREPILLRLSVSDPEVAAELWRLPEGPEREQYALTALRLGVLSLKMASGHLDATVIHEAEEKLVAGIRELLAARAGDIAKELNAALRQYFDPQSGVLPQRLNSVLRRDGELENLLRQHLGPDDSTIARTLAAHFGQGSPLLKILSPTETTGLLAQLTQILQTALAEQRERVLREFSLDNKESALARLAGELNLNQATLRDGMKGQIDALLQEFSTDNEQSALSRLSRLLQNTSDQISRNLTLDDEQSALARLKRELRGTLDEILRKNADFQAEVRAALSALQARKAEAQRTTTHGREFEAQLGELLALEAQRAGDLCVATGAQTGMIKNCKVGDFVIELGPDNAAAGAKIVWEAKESASYTMKEALAEMETARKNRSAQVGVFVFSKKIAPPETAAFSRSGADLVVVWDADDPAEEIYLRAAYSVAKALVVREARQAGELQQAVTRMERSTRTIEKQLQHFEEFRKWGETIKGHGEKIVARATLIQAELEREIASLDGEITALKSQPGSA